jgi:predicted aspartyl protease
MRLGGPLLQAEAHVPDAVAKKLSEESKAIPQSQTGGALIDTGASICCIDEAAATALGLQPIDQIQMCGVAGSKMHNVYIAKVSFPGTPLGSMEWRLVGGDLKEQKLLLLIGRDILRQCIFIYNGHLGIATITF